MTEEQVDLSRRVIDCPRWRWMPGMLAVMSNGVIACRVSNGAVPPAYPEPYLPDLTDPATIGCILALVREAWNAPRALVRLSANGKSFHVFDVDRVTMGGNWAAFLCGDRILQTEIEALVAALENAP